MNPRGSLHEKVAAMRAALLPYRNTGVALDAHAISVICASLSICAVEAEQLMLDRDRLLEQTNGKVTSLSRFRRSHPPASGDGNNGGSAA
jgi:hypothetical protein